MFFDAVDDAFNVGDVSFAGDSGVDAADVCDFDAAFAASHQAHVEVFQRADFERPLDGFFLFCCFDVCFAESAGGALHGEHEEFAEVGHFCVGLGHA